MLKSTGTSFFRKRGRILVCIDIYTGGDIRVRERKEGGRRDIERQAGVKDEEGRLGEEGKRRG